MRASTIGTIKTTGTDSGHNRGAARRWLWRGFLLSLLSTSPLAAFAGIVITGQVTPQSEVFRFLKEADLPELELSFIEQQARIAAHIADDNLAALGLRGTGCCYMAASFFYQLETGRTIGDRTSIRFADNLSSRANTQRFLGQRLEQPILFHHDINRDHSAANISRWLHDNLLEGEPTIFSINLTPNGQSRTVNHAVNALRLGEEVRIYDLGNGLIGVPVEQFLQQANRHYRVNLDQRVSVARVLRENVRYQFDFAEIAQRDISLDTHTLNLRSLSVQQLQQGLTRAELLETLPAANGINCADSEATP